MTGVTEAGSRTLITADNVNRSRKKGNYQLTEIEWLSQTGWSEWGVSQTDQSEWGLSLTDRSESHGETHTY